jgi:magnesium-transporting ATPase (P-type)
MQLSYRLYSLLCTLHPALCVLFLSLGFQPAVLTLVVVIQWSAQDLNGCPSELMVVNSSSSHHGSGHTGVDTFRVEPQLWALSSFYFLACVSSSIFAMVYLVAMDENTRSDDNNTLDYARGSDLLFWCFLFASTCLSLALPTRRPPPLDQLYWRCALHFGALFLLCTPKERSPQHHQLSLSIALLTLMASCLYCTIVACTQVHVCVFAHPFIIVFIAQCCCC